jgi:Amt family ammonium transporter
MFSHGNGFIGYHWFFLQGAPETYESTGVAFLAVWIFQFAFADTCSTITSGAMIGRTGFVGDLLYSLGVSGFIYPIIGHWAWGPDGFLATMGSTGNFLPSLGQSFHDFAGSTVVHTIGGFIALAGSIVLGPRLGRKFKRDGGAPMLPHDLTIAASGGLILWFGWYGFNPGSTLSAMDIAGIGRVSANTTLAACAAGLTAMMYAYIMTKKWDVGFTVNGFLAGLVAITCPCYWVSPTGSILLGGIAGVLVCLGVELLEWLRIDDPIGAVPVHGMCGIWGTLSLGLFASGQFGATGPTGPDNSAPLTGLFYGGGMTLLKAQFIGSAIVTVSTFTVALALMYLVNLTGTLRVSEEGELYGLDLHEHGISAYPEYVISSLAAPSGMPKDLTVPTPVYEATALHMASAQDYSYRSKEELMTKIEAIIRPNKFESVKEALTQLGIDGMTVSEVRGHGRQKGHTEVFRGREYGVDLLPKIKVELVIHDDLVDRAMEAIQGAAYTGKIGDGKIFLYSVSGALRIRSQERDVAAL